MNDDRPPKWEIPNRDRAARVFLDLVSHLHGATASVERVHLDKGVIEVEIHKDVKDPNAIAEGVGKDTPIASRGLRITSITTDCTTYELVVNGQEEIDALERVGASAIPEDPMEAAIERLEEFFSAYKIVLTRVSFSWSMTDRGRVVLTRLNDLMLDAM
jgi:hypothetical protein